MKFAICFFLSLLLFIPLATYGQYTQQSPTGGTIDWTNQVLREVGIGAPNPNMPIAAQRAGAIEAAKRVALRNLLERVKGMNINSEVTIEQFMVSNDIIRNKIQGKIRNFTVIDTRYKSDGSVEVEVEVPLSGIYETVLPDQFPHGAPVEFPAGTQAPSTTNVFTGLIIDARGLELRPALAPKVLDENEQEVYGTGQVSRDYAMQIGVVGYEKDLTRARANERVTNNPMIVKAIKTSGANKTDLVISLQDAQMIRNASENLSFLQQCKVMFVLD